MVRDLTATRRPTVRDAWNAGMAACEQADAAPTYAECQAKIAFAKSMLRGIRQAMAGQTAIDWQAPFPPQER